MRQESTLNERYVIADLSDSIDDRAYQRLLENMRAYLNEFYRGIFEKRGTQWDFQIQPESESNNIPTIKNLCQKETFSFWQNDPAKKGNDPDWRVYIDRAKIVVNYRKHLVTDPGSFEDFYSFVEEILKKAGCFLGISQWETLRLVYSFRFARDTLSEVFDGLAENWIEVKRLLQPFATMPTPSGFVEFIPNYQWNQSWRRNQDSKSYYTHAELSATPPPAKQNLNIRLLLEVTTNARVNIDNDGLMNLYHILQSDYVNLIVKGNAKIIEDCK